MQKSLPCANAQATLNGWTQTHIIDDSGDRANVQHSIAASRADIHTLSNISLPIFSHRLDRLLIRLRILATLIVAQAGLVLSIKFTFFNEQQHPADTASNSQPAAMLNVSGQHRATLP